MSQEPIPTALPRQNSSLKTVVIRLCCAVALIVLVGAGVFALKRGGGGRPYVSAGKLTVSGGDSSSMNFIATKIELFRDDYLKNRAIARVHGLHPEWNPQPFDIDAGSIAGTKIIEIRATAADPVFAQAILDAVMDEFLAGWTEQRAMANGGETVKGEIAKLEKEMRLAEQRSNAPELSGVGPEQMSEQKERLRLMKTRYEKLSDTARKLEGEEVQRGEIFSILGRASAAVMVPAPSIFKPLIDLFR